MGDDGRARKGGETARMRGGGEGGSGGVEGNPAVGSRSNGRNIMCIISGRTT